MEEHQIGWIAAIIIGGIAGWLAEQFMKSQMGLVMNIVLGIIGAAVASWLLGLCQQCYAWQENKLRYTPPRCLRHRPPMQFKEGSLSLRRCRQQVTSYCASDGRRTCRLSVD